MSEEYRNSVDFFSKREFKEPQNNTSLILAAYELKTPDNAGSIIRLAGNLGVKKVYFIHEDFKMRPRKMTRVAHSSIGHVDFKIVTESEFFEQIENDFKFVALETTNNSQNIFTHQLPKKCVLIAGNERFGINNEMLNKCHESVFIPNPGKTSSMNVSHALTVSAFEWARQHWPEQMNIK